MTKGRTREEIIESKKQKKKDEKKIRQFYTKAAALIGIFPISYFKENELEYSIRTDKGRTSLDVLVKCGDNIIGSRLNKDGSVYFTVYDEKLSPAKINIVSRKDILRNPQNALYILRRDFSFLYIYFFFEDWSHFMNVLALLKEEGRLQEWRDSSEQYKTFLLAYQNVNNPD